MKDSIAKFCLRDIFLLTEGQGLIPSEESIWFWLAYLNSSVIGYFLSLTSGLQKHYIYIRDIPFFNISRNVKVDLERESKRIVEIRLQFERINELSQFYRGPVLTLTDGNIFAEKVQRYIAEIDHAKSEIAGLN